MVKSESHEIVTAVSIDLSLPKPYFNIYADFTDNEIYRTYVVDSKVILAIIRHEGKLTKSINIELQSGRDLKEANRDEVLRRIAYEFGFEDDLKVNAALAKEDINYKYLVMNYPGYRLYANSYIHETLVLGLIAENMDSESYLEAISKLMKRFGKPVTWNKKYRAFPDPDKIESISEKQWNNLGIGENSKILSNLTQETLELIEIYTYYPIYERGVQKLKELGFLNSYIIRLLMIYSARRYERILFDNFTEWVVKEEFDREFKRLKDFDAWVESKWHDIPAMIFHPYILRNFSSYHSSMKFKF